MAAPSKLIYIINSINNYDFSKDHYNNNTCKDAKKTTPKSRQAYFQKLTRGCDWVPVERRDKYRIHKHSAWFDSDFSLKTLYLQTIQSIWTAFLYDSAQIKNVICYKTWLSCNLSWWVAVPRTLIASQKSAMHQLIEENVSGTTTFLDVWDILDNCAWRIANGTVY